jgi:hypothetical protein
MAGTIPDCELTRSRLQFREAEHCDDSEIRRLLRETPMPGGISLTLEREPNYFADANLPGETRKTIIARDSGKLVSLGSCATRELLVNGRKRRVGYLGALRMAATHSGRFDVLRRGYQFLSDREQKDPAEFYFTSIARDNIRARGFFERSVPGFPRYKFLSDYATLVIPSKRGKIRPTSKPLQLRSNPAHQFAFDWADEKLAALECLGLKGSDIISIGDESAALWDQRCFKQTVIRGYPGWLRIARPLLNAFGFACLPKVGAALSNGIVCGLRIADPNTAISLLSKLRSLAAERGIRYISLGLSGNDSHMATIARTFPCRIYWSRIYLVRWPGIGGSAAELDERLVVPELAFL